LGKKKERERESFPQTEMPDISGGSTMFSSGVGTSAIPRPTLRRGVS
jgi:hypothetical protein